MLGKEGTREGAATHSGAALVSRPLWLRGQWQAGHFRVTLEESPGMPLCGCARAEVVFWLALLFCGRCPSLSLFPPSPPPPSSPRLFGCWGKGGRARRSGVLAGGLSAPRSPLALHSRLGGSTRAGPAKEAAAVIASRREQQPSWLRAHVAFLHTRTLAERCCCCRGGFKMRHGTSARAGV